MGLFLYLYKDRNMRQIEDKRLRDFEIRQWFYILRNQYINEGMETSEATRQAYEDIGIRFCLRESSLRKAKNTALQPKENRERLMFEVRNNLTRLKQTIQRLEKKLGEHA